MEKVTFEQMLQAGVHFGHLKRKWNPHMAPYIFTEKKGIHIIDLHKTGVKLDEAASAMKQIAKSGKKILFVATKKQAKSIVAERVAAIGMPYVTERWSGGMLTNFATIRKAVRKMSQIDKMELDGTLNNLSKRERLQVSRQRAKLEKNLGSISDLTRIPAAIFIVDVMKEHIALAEAKKLGIPVFAMVDTNSDPRPVDFPIPSNDDAGRSIALVMDVLAQAVAEGLQERKADKDQAEAQAAAKKNKEEAPAESAAPAEEAPAEEAPAAEAPAEEAPAAEAPAEETAPAPEAPAEEAPAAEAPAEETAPAPEAPPSEEGEAPAAEEK
jgi:small subunit ribosomal protein S2